MSGRHEKVAEETNHRNGGTARHSQTRLNPRAVVVSHGGQLFGLSPGAGFLVVWLSLRVRGVRPALARDWHNQLHLHETHRSSK
jgi:hypothetical protein